MQFKRQLIFLVSFFFFLVFKPCFSQTENNYQTKFVNLLKNKEIHKHINTSYTGIIGFYKKYISTQDYGSCPYSPSCSIYSLNAIEKYGVVAGTIMAFDRLSRCNRNSENKYEHTMQNKIIDKP